MSRLLGKIEFPSGMTVAELKSLVENLPEKNDLGEDCEVWMETSDGISIRVRSVWPVDPDKTSSDIEFTN